MGMTTKSTRINNVTASQTADSETVRVQVFANDELVYDLSIARAEIDSFLADLERKGVAVRDER